jgi:sugar phosphate isomerase/epimerase
VTLGTGDLVLCSGTLARRSSFADRVAAARSGGFQGISLWGRDYQSARDEGLSDSDLRAILGENGLAVAELDPAWWWLPGAADIHIPPELDDQDVFGFGEAELFAIADSLGARSISAVDVFGGRWSLDDAIESFAALCRRAAEHGLLVHLEFLPWSKIPDLETAWKVVDGADQPNGGVAIDAWHYFRGVPDAEVLESIPGERILSIQLDDGPARPEPDLLAATLHDRLLPGEGEFDLQSLLGCLRRIGADAPVGVEVFSDALHLLDPAEIGRLAGECTRRVLSERWA